MVACVMPLKARLVLRLLHYAMRGGLMCLGELLFYNLYLFKTVHKHTHTHTHTHTHSHTHAHTHTNENKSYTVVNHTLIFIYSIRFILSPILYFSSIHTH